MHPAWRSATSNHITAPKRFSVKWDAGFVHAPEIIRLSLGTANPRKCNLCQLGPSGNAVVLNNNPPAYVHLRYQNAREFPQALCGIQRAFSIAKVLPNVPKQLGRHCHVAEKGAHSEATALGCPKKIPEWEGKFDGGLRPGHRAGYACPFLVTPLNLGL